MSVVRDVIDVLAHKLDYAFLVLRNPRRFEFMGVTLPLRATPELQRIRRAVYRGEYELPEIQAVRALIRPDDVVMELGSGCGVVSAVIARRLSDSRNLHTFEANPILLKSIEAVASANEISLNVVIAAIGVADGEADFHFDKDFLSSSMLDRGRRASTTSVKTLSFTKLLDQIQPSVVVFDIEGAERDILDIRFPDSVRVLCGELHPQIIGDHGVSKIIRNILSQGFDLLVDLSAARAFAFVRTAERVESGRWAPA